MEALDSILRQDAKTISANCPLFQSKLNENMHQGIVHLQALDQDTLQGKLNDFYQRVITALLSY